MTNVWSIRSFLNTDTPWLAQLWSAHHAAAHSPSTCSVSVWDQCILSKPYFDRDELAVAVDTQNRVVGFIHFGTGGQSRTLRGAPALIHKLCIAPQDNEDELAHRLLVHALEQLGNSGATDCYALGSYERHAFYLGVSDGDNLMGVVARDHRTLRWLDAAGFQPLRPTECWEIDLQSYRQPMDRNQIGVRRTCSIGRVLDDNDQPWWQSAVLGHCEQVRFHLMLRSPSRVEFEMMFWYPDPSIHGVDSNVVRLWLSDVPEGDEARERFLYLLAESLRQLQQERKRLVRTFASADQQPTISLLQRLGFRSADHGLVYARSLHRA